MSFHRQLSTDDATVTKEALAETLRGTSVQRFDGNHVLFEDAGGVIQYRLIYLLYDVIDDNFIGRYVVTARGSIRELQTMLARPNSIDYVVYLGLVDCTNYAIVYYDVFNPVWMHGDEMIGDEMIGEMWAMDQIAWFKSVIGG